MRYLNGSCLCGKVSIRIPDAFDFVGCCHCSECRKWSGSAFNAGGMLDSEHVEIGSGGEVISYFRKSGETDLGFCSNCGSSLFSRKRTRGKHIIRLGILDEVPSQRPQAHIFTASKAPWFEITDQLDQYEAAP